MTARNWLRLGEILVPVILAVTIFVSWQADRRDRAQLATQLAVAQQTIAQATASQHDRDNLLNQTLSQLAAQKQTAVTPAQVIKDLPSAISLPAPITLQSSAAAPSSATNRPDHTGPEPSQATNAVLPAADLRPLYDFALDCKACQAKLAASQGDLTDEKTKTAALTKERDAAETAAKGGSALRRIARAAKWFALGAAAGAIAAKAVR
ncbi:MAG: hypothetical protein WBR10_14540 [Candidatus Acidiferrum sp.]